MEIVISNWTNSYNQQDQLESSNGSSTSNWAKWNLQLGHLEQLELPIGPLGSNGITKKTNWNFQMVCLLPIGSFGLPIGYAHSQLGQMGFATGPTEKKWIAKWFNWICSLAFGSNEISISNSAMWNNLIENGSSGFTHFQVDQMGFFSTRPFE